MFEMILQNVTAKLACLNIVVAYMGVQYVLSPNFSKLGHCDLKSSENTLELNWKQVEIFVCQ